MMFSVGKAWTIHASHLVLVLVVHATTHALHAALQA
jgi:hypothetical protein